MRQLKTGNFHQNSSNNFNFRNQLYMNMKIIIRELNWKIFITVEWVRSLCYIGISQKNWDSESLFQVPAEKTGSCSRPDEFFDNFFVICNDFV